LDIRIDQRTIFSDGRPLLAARALVHTWPPSTIVASCLIGGVDQLLGASHSAWRSPGDALADLRNQTHRIS
jgi:hypothetical protein